MADNEYRCCCGCHVHPSTTFLAVVGLIFAVIKAVGVFINFKPEFAWYLNAITAGIVALATLGLLIGNLARAPCLHLPYIWIAIGSIISQTVGLILSIIGAISVSATDSDDRPKSDDGTAEGLTITFIFLFVVTTVAMIVIQALLVYIVNRDRQYLLSQQGAAA